MAASVLTRPQNSPEVLQRCFHCNEVCPPGSEQYLQLDDKRFCCDGCKMVYEILHEHDMCAYYDLDKNAGSSLRNKRAGKSFAYLDDPDVREKLIEFEQGDLAQVTFYFPQMHCVSCIWLLENLYKLDAGVTHSRVNFLKKTATIQFSPNQTSLRKLAALLSSIGYEPDINLGDVDGQKPKAISRRLAYQLGVAGFAFGNVMLFSFPDYVGLDRSIDSWFSNIFGYISLLIALPVLLYSAQDYFRSAWEGLRSRTLNIDIPLCLALGSLFGRSLWEIFTHTGPGYLDSFTGLTLLLLTGKWFQQRVWYRLSFERDYKSYFPVAANVRNGAEETAVPVNRLIPGDIIVVRSHEIIPADGILIKGTANIDYSFVTGESDPILVKNGEKIFAGGKQLGESIEITLTRRVAQSQLTKLWNNEAFKQQERGQVTRLADAAGLYFSWIILAFGAAAMLYWWGYRHDFATALNAFTAVMIVACPCNIAIAIPFTLGNIMRILGRNQFYIKNIRVVEAFSEINAVVFDKTGTITNVASQELRFEGEWTYADKVLIRSLVQHSAHPLSRRIYDSMPEVRTERPEQYQEMPGLGISGRVGGHEVSVGSAAFTGGLGTGVFVKINDRLLGHFVVKSHFRSGLANVLQFMRRLVASPEEAKTSNPKGGIFLLSGDQDKDAAALRSFFPESGAMQFNRSPQDKLDFVKKLQENGNRVMMLGDGLNDAGALRQSDLGIVVAENTNNFTPACDAIIHADEFERLPRLLAYARKGVRIVNRSYLVALSYNAIGLSFAMTGQLSPLVAAVLMPISSVSIVLFSVGMSNLAARDLKA